MRVTIPEALGLSLLGMGVVFVVLIFLMYIIYLMSAIIKNVGKRREIRAAESESGGEL